MCWYVVLLVKKNLGDAKHMMNHDLKSAGKDVISLSLYTVLVFPHQFVHVAFRPTLGEYLRQAFPGPRQPNTTYLVVLL